MRSCFFDQIDGVPSEQAKAFIKRGAIINPEDRATADDLLQDEWLVPAMSCINLTK